MDEKNLKTIVCKFGGTSMATSESVSQVEKIVKSDASRRYIVVSAPGKTAEYRKVTDVLIACWKEIEKQGNCDNTFYEIEKRFREIAEFLSDEEYRKIMSDVKIQIERDRR